MKIKGFCDYHKKTTKYISIGHLKLGKNIARITFKCKKCIKENRYEGDAYI